MERKTTDFEQGWDYIQAGITKLQRYLEGLPEPAPDAEQYTRIYTTAYDMCTQKPPHNYSQQLYDKYREAVEEYVNSTVLPALMEKQDDEYMLLQELVKRWSNHKKMVTYLSKIFVSLDSYFISRRSLPPLKEVGLTCFRDLVYNKLNRKLRRSVITLIDKEREGEDIDREVMKKAVEFYIEIGMGTMESYEEYFERFLGEDTSSCLRVLERAIQESILNMERKTTIGFEEGWKYIQTGITKQKRYLEGLGPALDAQEYVELYMTVYNMCTQKPPHDYSQQLHGKYRETVEEYLNSTVSLAVMEKQDDEYMLLQELVKRWSQYMKLGKLLFVIFFYLDRYFIARRSLPTLKEFGLTCFRDMVCNKLKHKVKEAVIALVDKEREGEDIDTDLMKKVVDLYIEIGVRKMDRYEQDFERFMLEGASSYYSRKASRWIEEDSFQDYILKSEECLEKEKERVTRYLHSSSVPKLIKKVEHELLVKYANQLLQQSEFREMARGLEHIANIFKKYVTDADGHEDTEEHVFIRKLIELQDKYMVSVTKYSQNHTLFYKTLKEEFESFCRQTVDGSSSNAELLATFCDRIILKKWGSEEELSDEDIEKVVILLAYISDDKYLFAEFYRKELALRLLLNRGANDHEHERNILTKLKQKFGKQITFKMEKMVTDLDLSRENQNRFSEYVANNSNAKPGIDFTVTLLTNGVWPSYKTCGMNLPSEMVKCVEVYKGFYEADTKPRKLTWIHSLGTCHINGNFDQKTIELIVSTHQAVVLLLFNTRDAMSYTDIQTQLDVSHEDLVWLLHSLSCAKYKILIKKPNTKTVSKTDVFEFNSKFNVGMRRVKISLPLTRVDESKKVVEDVDKERRYAIDAAIVRIMKGSKVLGHQKLVSECVGQLGRMFKPDIKAIKKRIENLISRDYLERDKENPNMFRYLA